jgi:hypothetical protein
MQWPVLRLHACIRTLQQGMPKLSPSVRCFQTRPAILNPVANLAGELCLNLYI